MTIIEREQQILRVSQQGVHKTLDKVLATQLSTEVVSTVKTVLESALQEEVNAFLQGIDGQKPHRLGFYHRALATQYGQIPDLSVPKLRQRNAERNWEILERYQRSLGSLLDWMCCLYVMGLSLRDLQEALYAVLGRVLSVNAVNQITLHVQRQQEARQTALLRQTPEIILVDGVWVKIQYVIPDEYKEDLLRQTPEIILVDGVWVKIQYVIPDEYKEDQSGHLRQCRTSEERVVLAVMAIWADGRSELLHYEVASGESEATWNQLL